jgi:hypothetical protein
MLTWSKHRTRVPAALVLLLFCKYFWTLVVFDAPLGYDAGIYRYLFLTHSKGFPPFVLGPIEPWARGHPLGLFFFSTMLLRLGVPVSLLLGWMWNLMAVLLLCALAFVWQRERGGSTALWVLAAAILSQAVFDGFTAMYWKTFLAMFFMVLAFDALHRHSHVGYLWGLLTVVTHHQTGLLFGLAAGTWFLLERERLREHARWMFAVLLLVAVTGVLWYLPVWQQAVADHLPALFGSLTNAPSGSFPDLSEYLRFEWILYGFGVLGLAGDLRAKRWDLWQLSVLWSAVFVLCRLFFYRRFTLQLEFFLLPYMALGAAWAWQRYSNRNCHKVLIALLVLQVLLSFAAMRDTDPPLLDRATLNRVTRMGNRLPQGAYVLALEDEGAMMLRGWLPDQRVEGPGLFGMPWGYGQWEALFLGTPQQRRTLLRSLPSGTVLFTGPRFALYYGQVAHAFVTDPCLARGEEEYFYTIACP